MQGTWYSIEHLRAPGRSRLGEKYHLPLHTGNDCNDSNVVVIVKVVVIIVIIAVGAINVVNKWLFSGTVTTNTTTYTITII